MTTAALLKTAWKQRCTPEGNWILTPAQRAWLTLKFMLCLLFMRELGIEHDAPYDTHVVVAVTDSHQYPCEWGTCYDWREWRVGKGLLRNWWYFETTDGSP